MRRRRPVVASDGLVAHRSTHRPGPGDRCAHRHPSGRGLRIRRTRGLANCPQSRWAPAARRGWIGAGSPGARAVGSDRTAPTRGRAVGEPWCTAIVARGDGDDTCRSCGRGRAASVTPDGSAVTGSGVGTGRLRLPVPEPASRRAPRWRRAPARRAPPWSAEPARLRARARWRPAATAASGPGGSRRWRDRGRRHRLGRGRGRGAPWREEAQRIEVAVRIGADRARRGRHRARGARRPRSGRSSRPTAPSATWALRRTAIEPRWTSVTEYPSVVAIATLRPLVATAPANVTVPPRGATTGEPAAPPMSIPRCCPPAYGLFPRWNPASTGPDAGHVQAPAAGASTRKRNAVAATVRVRDNMRPR